MRNVTTNFKEKGDYRSIKKQCMKSDFYRFYRLLNYFNVFQVLQVLWVLHLDVLEILFDVIAVTYCGVPA